RSRAEPSSTPCYRHATCARCLERGRLDSLPDPVRRWSGGASRFHRRPGLEPTVRQPAAISLPLLRSGDAMKPHYTVFPATLLAALLAIAAPASADEKAHDHAQA